MNGWLALSLSLLLGQSPTASTSTPAEADTTAATDTQDTGTDQQQQPPLSPEEQSRLQALELNQLRTQLESLQAQMAAQQEAAQSRIQSLEQRQSVQSTRANELEQLRQQRIVSIQRAYDSLTAAARLLEGGELAIGPALDTAQQDIAAALATAEEAGRGQTSTLIQSALERLPSVATSVSERDLYPARLQLQAAGAELSQALWLTLNRQGTTLVNQ